MFLFAHCYSAENQAFTLDLGCAIEITKVRLKNGQNTPPNDKWIVIDRIKVIT